MLNGAEGTVCRISSRSTRSLRTVKTDRKHVKHPDAAAYRNTRLPSRERRFMSKSCACPSLQRFLDERAVQQLTLRRRD
jgi:hypothetical protein